MVRRLILPLVLLSVGMVNACTSVGSDQSSKVVQALCLIDGLAQPVAVDVGEVIASDKGYGSEAQLAAAIDAKLHARIVAVCAAKGGAVVTDEASSN